jgi:hypothetical protein
MDSAANKATLLQGIGMRDIQVRDENDNPNTRRQCSVLDHGNRCTHLECNASMALHQLPKDVRKKIETKLFHKCLFQSQSGDDCCAICGYHLLRCLFKLFGIQMFREIIKELNYDGVDSPNFSFDWKLIENH